MTTLTFAPSWTAQPTALRHTWEGMGNIDQFRWFQRADTLDQLRLARDELGLKHVRAVAMYGPEQRVWTHRLADWRSKDKVKSANWQFVDISLDHLVDLGLKPIYTTCFTPGEFTDSDKTVWPDRNHCGMPRDLGQWAAFVADGLRHHLDRYGIAELRSWYFEVWNEPNLGGFFDGTQEQFFKLWSATWRAVKGVHPDLRFGGPSTARAEWIPEFLDFAAKDGTPPDFLVGHVYNNDSESNPLSPFDGPAVDRVKDSPHFASGVIRGTRKLLDARGWKGEIHWNEWGRSWFPSDAPRESAREAAFVAKTMGEVSQDGDWFAYWCLSDIYDQIGVSTSEFEGNYGLLSLHGLRKPAYQAHRLLARLGSCRVTVDGGDALQGALATVDGGSRVLLWRYPEKPDAAVTSERVSVRLPGKPALAPRLFRIDAREHNILAAWRDLGAPTYLSRAQLADLRAANGLIPAAPTALTVRQDGGAWFAEFDLERPGVALLEVG